MTHPTGFHPEFFVRPGHAARRVPVAVSACLTGERVRYDAGHKRLATTIELLDANLTLLPLCPEVAAGLGVPRPPVQLVATDNGPRALGRDDVAFDVTGSLRHIAARSVAALSALQPPLCGYIWKSRSPSCGWGSAPLVGIGSEILPRGAGPGSAPRGNTTDGLQAAEVRRRMPWLPVAEETTLEDDRAARRFVLLCRLVGEVLDETLQLTEVAQCQRAFRERWQANDADGLADSVARDDRRGYAEGLCHGLAGWLSGAFRLPG